MNLINNIIFVLIITLSIASCTKDLEIDIPEKENKLVIYSTLVPFTFPQPKQLRVDVTSTKHIFDTTRNTIKDATVLLYNNNLTDTLRYIDSLGFYPLNFHPDVDDQLRITVKKKGFETVTSSTHIPGKVQIIDTNLTPIAYFSDNDDVYSEISVSFKDPVNEKNYYSVMVSDIAYSKYEECDFYRLSTNDPIITSESYYPSIIRYNLATPKELLFTDETINGKEHTLVIYYYPPQGLSAKKWISDHHISIHLRNVTKEYFQYKTTLIHHLNNREEDYLYGMAEPLDVVSNIENGYGLFAGFNNDIIAMHIKKTFY